MSRCSRKIRGRSTTAPAGRISLLEGCVLGASRLIDKQPADEASAGTDPRTEPGIAADSAKNGAHPGAGGRAGQRALLGWSHVGAGNDRHGNRSNQKEPSHPIPRSGLCVDMAGSIKGGFNQRAGTDSARSKIETAHRSAIGPSDPAPLVFVKDARYEKIRQGGAVVSCAMLIAVGVTEDGRRSVLGASVSLSEAEVHWRDFFAGLQGRGLHGVELIISDDHAGLKAAREARFPGVPWQRCQFHLQRNAGQYVPKLSLRAEVARELRAIFDAPDRAASGSTPNPYRRAR